MGVKVVSLVSIELPHPLSWAFNYLLNILSPPEDRPIFYFKSKLVLLQNMFVASYTQSLSDVGRDKKPPKNNFACSSLANQSEFAKIVISKNEVIPVRPKTPNEVKLQSPLHSPVLINALISPSESDSQSRDHQADSQGNKCSSHEYVSMTSSSSSSTSETTNLANVRSLQILECPNSFVTHLTPMAFVEGNPQPPVLLTSCFPDPQSAFNFTGGNMSYSQGSCQSVQYLMSYPVNGFGSNLLPLVLPVNPSVPIMDCFNIVTYYTQVPCTESTQEELVTSCNLSNVCSSQERQLYLYHSSSDVCISRSVEESNMPKVWHQTFDDLFRTFPDQWNLIPSPEGDPKTFARKFKDNAKVRFMCRECRNAWTSMKGCIVFWVNLDVETKTGEVYFRLFGQQCQKCDTKEFQYSMWYPEEVKKVLGNLGVRVGSLFYGLLPPVEFVNCRRQGKPRSPHNSSLCQACFNKVCTETLK